jgi:hypothetical protein
MAYVRRARGSGIGGIIAGVVILALLAAVAYVVWWRGQQAQKPTPKDTGPRATIKEWKLQHGLSGPDVPEPLGSDWHFSFEKGPYWKIGGPTAPQYPTSWVDILLERGRFTTLVIATYRDSQAEPPMALVLDFAGEVEGPQLLALVRELGGKPNGSELEGETAQYRFFGWRYNDESCPRRWAICMALKGGGPKTDALYAQEKSNWTAMPKKKPEPRPAAKEPPKTPPAQEPPKTPPAQEPPKAPPPQEPAKAPPAQKPPEPSPVERAL